MIGRITWHDDYKNLKKYIPAQFSQMKELEPGQLYIMTQNGWGLIQIRRRNTTDLGKTPAFRKRERRQRPSKLQLKLPLDSHPQVLVNRNNKGDLY